MREVVAISKYEGETSHSASKMQVTTMALPISVGRPLVKPRTGRIPLTKSKIPMAAVTTASQRGGMRPLATNTARKKIVAIPRTMNRKLLRFRTSGNGEEPLRTRDWTDCGLRDEPVREPVRARCGGEFSELSEDAEEFGLLDSRVRSRSAASEASNFSRAVRSSRVALASDKSLNASDATLRRYALSTGTVSGWTSRAFTLNAASISASDAFSGTPRIS